MPSNAAIYIADPSILGSRTFDGIEEIQSYEGLNKKGLASGVRLQLRWGSVVLNFMPPEQLKPHLDGFASYAERVIKNRDTLIYALARIHHARMCLGCIIEHASHEESPAQQFLFDFNSELNGILFLNDSIFDRDAQPLGGPAAVQ
jgi:hypothetical protein